jgi:hypothetical protein
MSAANLIKRFGQNVVVKRDTNPEARVKGKRVDDIRTEFTIIASVQPAQPDEVLDESPGNERNSAAIKLYSFDELKAAEVENQLKSDLVVYLGEDYEVQQVDKWIDNKRNLVHYKSIAFKVNIRRNKP